MEGQRHLHKRDHHTTNISGANVTTQKTRRKRTKTPLILKLILTIIFVSIWWLVVNVYVMNRSFQSLYKDADVDIRQLEDPDFIQDDLAEDILKMVKDNIDSEDQKERDVPDDINEQEHKMLEQQAADFLVKNPGEPDDMVLQGNEGGDKINEDDIDDDYKEDDDVDDMADIGDDGQLGVKEVEDNGDGQGITHGDRGDNHDDTKGQRLQEGYNGIADDNHDVHQVDKQDSRQDHINIDPEDENIEEMANKGREEKYPLEGLEKPHVDEFDDDNGKHQLGDNQLGNDVVDEEDNVVADGQPNDQDELENRGIEDTEEKADKNEDNFDRMQKGEANEETVHRRRKRMRQVQQQDDGFHNDNHKEEAYQNDNADAENEGNEENNQHDVANDQEDAQGDQDADMQFNHEENLDDDINRIQQVVGMVGNDALMGQNEDENDAKAIIRESRNDIDDVANNVQMDQAHVDDKNGNDQGINHLRNEGDDLPMRWDNENKADIQENLQPQIPLARNDRPIQDWNGMDAQNKGVELDQADWEFVNQNNAQNMGQGRVESIERARNERDLVARNEDVKNVQDGLDNARNERMLHGQEEKGRQKERLINFQDEIAQDNQIEANKQLNDMQNDNVGDGAVDYPENAEPEATPQNGEEADFQIKRKQLFEKFKSFLDEKAKETVDEQQMGTMHIERKRPAREKIRNMDERTLLQDPNALGEGGKGLKELPWEHEAVQREWAKAEFNLYFSDKISLERSLPEARNHKCLTKYYPYSLLPKTSIIICYTDEAWSPLLRSLHSIINRSPEELIEEIILVDDFSQADHLKKPLEDYISQFPQVKLVRLPYRHGLIRARLAGVEASRGSVLTFLDSHIEVNVGWLEPLLDRIRENRTNVVTPVIDAIDAHTLGYVSASDHLRGGFSWVALQFRWRTAPVEVMRARKDPTDGLPSPTMAGGLFSIDKQYFIELGTYDPGLEIWGAENLELSFKIWMCGGRLEVLPCSRIGHIFRAKQPYKFPSGNNVATYMHNVLRVVNVWLDEYKDVFYAINPNLIGTNYGDITERLRFRGQLQCKNFDWYVKNVYTDLEIPPADAVAAGSLQNKKFQRCLDKNGDKDNLAVFPCHGQGGNQAFRLTSKGVLAVGEGCVIGSPLRRPSPLMAGSCKSPQVIHWHHMKNGYLRNKKTKLCLGVAADKKLAMMPCFQTGPHLQWTFERYFAKKPKKSEAL